MIPDEANCYLPTQRQIAAACAVIRASWTPKTAERRRELGPDKIVLGVVSKELAQRIDLAMQAAACPE